MRELFSLLKPYVRLSGDEWRPPWKMLNRTLLDYLLVYIVKGTGLFSVAGRNFNVEPGDLVWVPPDTPHEMAGTSDRMHVRWVHFDLQYHEKRSHWSAFIPGNRTEHGKMARHLHPKLDHPVINNWTGRLRLPNHAIIGGLLEKLSFEHLFGGQDAQIILSGLILQILGEMERGFTLKTNNLQSRQWSRMQGVLAQIQQCAEVKLSIAELANKANLSASHFRKVFRETHGQNPRTLHRMARLQRGRDLLLSTSLTVSQIAYRLGFSTVHNFSRSFKNSYGVSPLRFRKGG